VVYVAVTLKKSLLASASVDECMNLIKRSGI